MPPLLREHEMSLPMYKQRSVDPHNFAMIPRADIPRSVFKMDYNHKTTFSAGDLVPIYLQEVLPGDSFNVRLTAFCRLATPIYPIMDNIHLESFFFFVPMRLVWANARKFWGEQDSPADSIAFTVPQIVSPAGGFARFGIYDYMGLPCTPNLGANTISISALPLRAYALIYHEWFRDENLVNSTRPTQGDGPDLSTAYSLFKRGKRHDYFTSALPWPQKGTAAPLIVSGTAPVKTASTIQQSGIQTQMYITNAAGGITPAQQITLATGTATLGGVSREVVTTALANATGTGGWYPANLYADLSAAAGSTINQLRQAFQIQRLLERDARGGTRYTEIVRSHFGVISPDARLQRPEYLGGGHSAINVQPIAQQTQTGLTGGSTPLGTLGAVGAGIVRGDGFNQSFTEHGYIIGLVNVRADLSYQQGIRKLWSRSTRYDFYFPVFAHLGEQAILNKEIYAKGDANDALVFGYQERWAEYRYHPSEITGAFNSTFTTPLDAWHLSEEFASLPALNSTFITDPTEATLRRALAVGAAADDQQLIGDFFFDQTVARPLPMYSVPGMMDHF